MIEEPKYIYFEYEGKHYRRILLNDIRFWFCQKEVYHKGMKKFIKQWDSFMPDEKMEKVYLRQKKFERLFNENE